MPDIYNEDITAVPAREKVHIRGLDELATDDVMNFAAQHYSANEPIRVQWVDDTSANLVYTSEEIATEALHAFSDPQAITDPTASQQMPPSHERPAKRLSSHPNIALAIRQALTTDVKKSHAREASRFYLMNPDKDPENRPRKNLGRGGPRKRRYESDDGPEKPFDVNMYDDESLMTRARSASHGADSRQAKRHRGGTARDTEAPRRRNPNAGKELFRHRSASPRRQIDSMMGGRLGFEDLSGDSRPRGRNAGRELFADHGSSSVRELFPNHMAAPLKESNGNAGRELFPNATSNSRASSPFHRRTDAFDIDDHLSNSPKVERHARPVRSLADRITSGPGVSPSRDRGRPETQQGFAIKGAHARVRELFPEKTTEGDLFGPGSGSGSGGGRRSHRKRAEDLFD